MGPKDTPASEPDPRLVYGDIIDLPHHQSSTRPHMSLYQRAAQFASFDALTGYSQLIGEEARVTDQRQATEESSLELLDQKMRLIAQAVEEGQRPLLDVTCFIPDEKKEGGRYETLSGTAEKVDLLQRTLVLDTGQVIELESIASIHGALTDYLDDTL